MIVLKLFFPSTSSLAAGVGPAPHPLLAPLPALPDRGADEEEAHHHQLGPQVAPHIHILVINLVNIVNNLAIFTMLNLLLNLTILSENNYVSSLQRLVSDYRKPLEETQPPILSQAKVDMLCTFSFGIQQTLLFDQIVDLVGWDTLPRFGGHPLLPYETKGCPHHRHYQLGQGLVFFLFQWICWIFRITREIDEIK